MPKKTNKEIEQRRLLNTREASRLLGISERSLWALSNRKEIATVRIGRTVRFDPKDIDSFVSRKKRE